MKKLLLILILAFMSKGVSLAQPNNTNDSITISKEIVLKKASDKLERQLTNIPFRVYYENDGIQIINLYNCNYFEVLIYDKHSNWVIYNNLFISPKEIITTDNLDFDKNNLYIIKVINVSSI